METIEERAKEYAHQYRRDAHDLKGERADAAFAAYCQGAEDERAELTRWRDPKHELPEGDKEVLCIVHHQSNTYEVMCHDKHGWWQRVPFPGGGWCACGCDIVGWREIHE